MADSKEKNLLNEIAYLTRLIGQHKHQLASNKTWNANVGYKFSAGYSGANAHLLLTKSAKPTQVTSFRHASVAKQKPIETVKTQHRENIQQKTNIHLNPKFQSASLPSTKVSNPKPLNSKVPRVLINPNFYKAASKNPHQASVISKIGDVNISDLKTVSSCLNEAVSKNPSHVKVISKIGDLNISDSKAVKSSDIASKSNSTPEQKLKVHVNPKFCKVLPAASPHTQLRTLMAKKVHVNPKLVERVLKEKNEGGFAPAAASGTKVVAQQPSTLCFTPSVLPKANSVNLANSFKQNVEKAKLISQVSSRRNEFITLGNRKLIRINRRQDSESKREKFSIRRNSNSCSRPKRIPMVSPRTLKRAKSITSKYKLVKIHSPSPSLSPKANVKTKYKIDRTTNANFYRRSPKKDNLAVRLKKKLPQRQRRFPVSSSRTCNGNMVWKRTWSLLAEEFKTTNTKLYRIGSSPIVKKNTVNTSKANDTFSTSLVRIGGVLYKSSRTKLTRSQGPVNTPKKKNSPFPLKKKGKLNTKQQFLLIRGHKFVMDAQGKTLRRMSPAESSQKPSSAPSYSLRRVDIGGVTFVQKSSNVLMRTDTHRARSLLSYAKQKSIATLMKKLKKNNQPCIFYRRFGRCLRNEKGKCPCVHDRKHVDVCKRFLQAKCSIDGCLLSHDVVPEKMPTCKFFLEGCCTKTDCPYLHVKVNAKADICTSFLQGYCSNAEKCKKRHINICPDFEKKGKCLKGKNCPYPHTKARKNPPKKRMSIKVSKPPPPSSKLVLNWKKRALPSGKVEMKRYYLTPGDPVGVSSNSDNSGNQKLEECKSNANIPCSNQVSRVDDQKTTAEDRMANIIPSKFIIEREKIGSLPSFIPL